MYALALRGILISAAAVLLLVPAKSEAYGTWSQGVNDVGNCAGCHGAFREGTYFSEAEGISWGDDLHAIHLDSTDITGGTNGSCDNCHGGTGTSGREVDLASSANAKDGVNAMSCLGCHGRLEDANNLGFFGEPGWGSGLRQHHETSTHVDVGAGTCSGCHPDANPASFTPAPENTMPAWYASMNPAMDPCSPLGEEDFSGNGTGTDNDGDHAYDLFEDSDCAEPQPFSVVIAVTDVDGGGDAEVGIVAEDLGTGAVTATIRDSITGALVNTISFGTDPARAATVIDDINGNGFQEIVVLGTRPSGHVRVQIRDSGTGLGIQTIFYGTQFEAREMAVMPDTDGNNAVEIAVLGISASGGVRVQARDVLTQNATSTTYYSANADTGLVLVMPDISGNNMPEVIVGAIVTATGQMRTQIRDADTGALVRNINFGSTYEPIDTALVGDVSGDGKPDLAVLGRRADTGVVRVQVRSTSDGSVISNAFLGNSDAPVSLVGIGDANTNASPDIAVLVERSGGGGKVVLRDGASGAFIGNIFSSKVNQPRDFVLAPDIDVSGDPELAVLGDSIDTPGTDRIQIKDSIAGTPINEVDFP